MTAHHEEFTKVWQAEAPRVMAYARRHVGNEEAHDVVAETFLIAWRRWSEVPQPAIGWLIVTARQVMSNRVRSIRRQQALADRIALLDEVAAYAADTADLALSRREALERLARLDEQHREALLLISWDGLTNDEAAEVLSIKPAAFRRRLSRARAALLAPVRVDTKEPQNRFIPIQEAP